MREQNPEMSIRALAAKLKCSQGTVVLTFKKLDAGEPLCDAPRPGRPCSLKGKALEAALLQGTKGPKSSCRKVAAALRQQGIANVCPKTVFNTFKRCNLVYGSPKRVIMVTPDKEYEE